MLRVSRALLPPYRDMSNRVLIGGDPLRNLDCTNRRDQLEEKGFMGRHEVNP